jgi:hypothetical protein
MVPRALLPGAAIAMTMAMALASATASPAGPIVREASPVIAIVTRDQTALRAAPCSSPKKRPGCSR